MAEKKQTKHRETPIPKKKLEAVKKLTELLKDKKTVLIASTKNLPDSQFQDIRKKLRGKAEILLPKKNIFIRAIDNVGNEKLKSIKDYVQGDSAVIFSDLDSFELAVELVEKRSSVKARNGQEATEDIEIPEGPTELVPGPAISELGAVGIQIAIEGGKIHIKANKVIVRKGEKISTAAADVMAKLDIKPFTVGFEPLVAFDTKEEKLYTEIKIDKQGTLNELKVSFNRAIGFAVNLAYTAEDTIKLLIGKAGRQGLAIEKLGNAQSENTDGGNQ